MDNKSNKHKSWGRVKFPLLRRVVSYLPLLATCFVAGEVYATESVMPQVEAKSPIPFPSDSPGRPAYVSKWQRHFEAGNNPIGELQGGFFCVNKGTIQWNAKAAEFLLPTSTLFARFRAELQKNNYPVPPPKVVPLQEKADDGATSKEEHKPADNTLQIGVIISQVQTNLCQKSTSSWTGEAYIKLEWQVFAPEQQKVIFKTTSEGVFRTKDKAMDGPISVIPVEAFAVASRNLLAEPNFLAAVQTPYDATAAINTTSQGATVAATQTTNPLSIDNIAPAHADGGISKNITDLRSAVVTVLSEGKSGTGFYIGSSGWLLTNQHVVGNAKFVKVRMPTGRELVAEVQRVDATRDVALLKTEPIGIRPIPLRIYEPAIGEDVYALGSPLGDTFNTSLTHGILSGVRVFKAQEYLQSDVAILPGSSGGPLLDKSGQAIGITVSGLGAAGVAGMNFFIPLGSAIDKLQLQLQTAKNSR